MNVMFAIQPYKEGGRQQNRNIWPVSRGWFALNSTHKTCGSFGSRSAGVPGCNQAANELQIPAHVGVDRYWTVSLELGPTVEAEMLHRNYLKSAPLGQRWVADCIPIAKAMGVRVVLLPFFGKGALETAAEMDKVGDILKEVAPAAEKSGVILGLEDTISARDNVRIMERSKSPAVLTYYDVGNSTKGGFNVVEEIRWLGGKRICEVHLKDNPHYLGEGTIDFKAVVDALADIVVDRWGFSHEAPNLGILGASVMGTTGARNPTLTVQALAWRTAAHLISNWKSIAP